MSDEKPTLYASANECVFQGVSAVLGDCFCLRQLARGCSDSETRSNRALEELGQVKYQRGDVGVVDSESVGFGVGLGLMKRIYSANNDIPWVLLSRRDMRRCLSFAVSHGVRAIVPDNTQLEYFRTAVNAVSAGQSCFDNAILLERAAAGINFRRGCPYSDGLLTKRELEVFELIGSGNPVRIISQTLKLKPKTVDSHKQNIMDGLGLKGTKALLMQAIYCADCGK